MTLAHDVAITRREEQESQNLIMYVHSHRQSPLGGLAMEHSNVAMRFQCSHESSHIVEELEVEAIEESRQLVFVANERCLLS